MVAVEAVAEVTIKAVAVTVAVVVEVVVVVTMEDVVPAITLTTTTTSITTSSRIIRNRTQTITDKTMVLLEVIMINPIKVTIIISLSSNNRNLTRQCSRCSNRPTLVKETVILRDSIIIIRVSRISTTLNKEMAVQVGGDTHRIWLMMMQTLIMNE